MYKALLFLFAAAALYAQNPSPIQSTGVAPSGACGSTNVRLLVPNGTIYTCQGGVWAPVSSGGGGGTVTEVKILGTTNQITVTGTCDITTSGTCTVSLPATLVIPTGTTGTTQSPGDNSTKIATTAYVDTAGGSLVPTTRTISTTPPLAGGGDLSVNRTFTCNVASGSQPGCLSSADWTTFNGKGSGSVTSAVIAGTANQVTVAGTCTITTTGTCTISLPAGVILGTDASAAGTLQLANGAGGGAHTIWASGATTTNTIAGFTAVPTTGHVVTCTVVSTTCTLTDGGALATGTVTSITIAGTANQVTVAGTCTVTTSGTCTISLPAGVILGADNSAAGTLQLANGSANAHTIWASGATTTNTIAGFTAVPANAHLVTCTVSGTTCTLTDGGAVPSAGASPAGTASESQARNDATTFQAVTGTSVIPLTGWTRVNSSLLNNFSANDLVTTVLGNATLNYRFNTRSVPDATFTIIARMSCLLIQNTNTSTCGIYLTDGTKFEGMEAISQGSVVGTRFVTAATVTTSPTVVVATTTPQEWDQVVKIVEDGVHTTWSYWENGAFVQFTQRNTHTFLTPSTVGFGGVDVINATTLVVNHLLYYCYAAAATSCNGF